MWKFATAMTDQPDTVSAALQAWQELTADIGDAPHWLLIQSSGRHDPADIIAALGPLARPGSLHGTTSRFPAFGSTAGGNSGCSLTLTGISDPGGSWGVGSAACDGSPREAGAAAVSQALLHADRIGETPPIVLLSTTPGQEEEVIRGIESVIGPHVPILGGSCASSHPEITAQVHTARHALENGVVVTVMFPSVTAGTAVYAAYAPTHCRGIATGVNGRTLLEIDGRPAADVLTGWRREMGLTALPDGLADPTLPLGIPVKRVHEAESFRLASPVSTGSDGSLLLGAEAEEGYDIVLMQPHADGNLAALPHLCSFAADLIETAPNALQGALFIECDTGRQRTGDDSALMAELAGTLGATPFSGWYADGVQGRFLDRRNHHGSRMAAAIVFGR